MTPVLTGAGKSPRTSWFYFTENELSPGADPRTTTTSFSFNLRGDDGASTGGLAVDTNLGWKGAEKYVATVPQVFDLWAGPAGALRHLHEQLHRADLDGRGHGGRVEEDHGHIREIPARASCRAMAYTGPITLSNYERFQSVT